MINNKIITYISFAKKSGSLYIGFDSVKSSIFSKKSNLVILFDDASDKTKKEIKKISDINYLKYIVLPLQSDEVEHIFHKKVVVIAIRDKNLSSAILKLIN